jgi:hypothetical protein
VNWGTLMTALCGQLYGASVASPSVVHRETEIVLSIRWLALEGYVRRLNIAELFEIVSKGR